MTPSVLIVEDDPKIAALVRKNLEAAGFACRVAGDGHTALREVAADLPALIVLDLMIPGVDGLEVCRRVRRQTQVPVLMLTARSGESDKVLGLEIGADDYLTKPFSTAELVARVRALLRRSAPARESALVRGALEIDLERRTVSRGGEAIEVTTLEFDLLVFMAEREGRVFTRDDLLAHVWGEDRVVDARSIDSLISRLRRKLERDPAHPQYLQTVWGAGYRYTTPAESG
ncbi:MAG: response regulator transcription factor [Candidatus Eisenbacteria bacterium]|nr:response regulator transcription factor [Candidatus Eisenbacteria bacterium]MCC7141469.1 response regulator transcription factor [Candidatus Eisenbacteria bacterium]